MLIFSQQSRQINSAVVVLANLMKADGTLNIESKSRADLAAKVVSDSNAELIVTTGWAYRPDSEISIAKAMACYLISTFDLASERVLVDSRARDTVGDAIFTKERLVRFGVNEILLVTSDYHLERAAIIFKALFPPSLAIRTFAAPTCMTESKKKNKLEAEKKSLDQFYQMFSGVSFESDTQLKATLAQNHPFYNGDVFPKLNY